MGYILAGGCSYTDPKYRRLDTKQIVDWDMWPVIIGKHRDKEVVNLGSSGWSNNHIFCSLYDYISSAKTDPDHVYVLLSGWDRVAFLKTSEIFTSYIGQEFDIFESHHNQYWRNDGTGWGTVSASQHIRSQYVMHHARTVLDAETLINNTLREVYLFVEFCRNRNITLTVLQGVAPWGFQSYEDPTFIAAVGVQADLFNIIKFTEELVSNQYFNLIDDINDSNIELLKWPWLPQLGGSFFDDIRDITNTRISEDDMHPNNVGQNIIADIMLKGK